MRPMNDVWYVTTRSEFTEHTDSSDVHTADDIAWCNKAARLAFVHTPALIPSTTTGAGLAGIGFVNLDGATCLIVQLPDHLGIAGRANLLRLLLAHLLAGIIERLADVTAGIRESIGHFACCFVRDIAHPTTRLIQHLCLASLQASPVARSLDHRGLTMAQACQHLVAPLHGGLRFAATNKNSCLSIGGSDQRVHAEVNTNNTLLRAWLVGYLADNGHTPHAQMHFHHTSRKGNRNVNVQRTRLAVGQDQHTIAHPCILIRIHDIAVAQDTPGIIGLFMAILAQLARGLHSFQEIGNGLLHRLSRQVRILALGPSLPSGLSGPYPTQAADAVMALDHVIP